MSVWRSTCSIGPPGGHDREQLLFPADIGSLYAFRKISAVRDKYRGTDTLVQAVQSNKCEQCRQEVYPFFCEVQIRSFHVLKSASESDIWMMQVYVLFMTLLCICLNTLFRCRRRVLLLFVWSSVGTCNYSVAAIHGFFFGSTIPNWWQNTPPHRKVQVIYCWWIYSVLFVRCFRIQNYTKACKVLRDLTRKNCTDTYDIHIFWEVHIIAARK
jgi:hypothetical protein